METILNWNRKKSKLTSEMKMKKLSTAVTSAYSSSTLFMRLVHLNTWGWNDNVMNHLKLNRNLPVVIHISTNFNHPLSPLAIAIAISNFHLDVRSYLNSLATSSGFIFKGSKSANDLANYRRIHLPLFYNRKKLLMDKIIMF